MWRRFVGWLLDLIALDGDTEPCEHVHLNPTGWRALPWACAGCGLNLSEAEAQLLFLSAVTDSETDRA